MEAGKELEMSSWKKCADVCFLKFIIDKCEEQKIVEKWRCHL